VKTGLASQIDWRLTTIAAFSFLGHFGLVGALYSDWTDPVVDDGIDAGLIQMVQKTLAESPPVQATDPPPEPVTTGPDQRPSPHPSPPPAPVGVGVGASPHPPTPDPRAIQHMLSGIDRTRISILTALDPGRALAVATSPGTEGPPVDLGDLARRADGIDNGGHGDLHLPPGAEPILVSTPLENLIAAYAPPVSSSAGPLRAVAPPFDVQYPRPTFSVPVADAEAVIRTKIHPGARRCYQKGLELDPTQSGRLVVEIKVAPNGEVDTAAATANGGLSAAVVACIAQVAKRAKFDAPGPSGSTLSIPFNFVRQGR
jgi:hypothetical protein